MMVRHSILRIALGGCCAIIAMIAAAQEGFPLDGTWRGEWGDDSSGRNHVVIVMKWDGETITGRINPGPNSISFSDAWLDPADWGVHIEAAAADGAAIRIDATLMDIGSWNRRVVGTWRQNGTEYEFNVTRE